MHPAHRKIPHQRDAGTCREACLCLPGSNKTSNHGHTALGTPWGRGAWGCPLGSHLEIPGAGERSTGGCTPIPGRQCPAVPARPTNHLPRDSAKLISITESAPCWLRLAGKAHASRPGSWQG